MTASPVLTVIKDLATKLGFHANLETDNPTEFIPIGCDGDVTDELFLYSNLLLLIKIHHHKDWSALRVHTWNEDHNRYFITDLQIDDPDFLEKIEQHLKPYAT